MLPYATLPSMHVAYCALATGLLATALPGAAPRRLGAAVVLAVAVSTLTLKEHVVLDVVTGLVLAQAGLWWWRREVPA